MHEDTVTIRYDDRSLTPAELRTLLDGMDVEDERFPARAVFHRDLRSDAAEAIALAGTLSVSARAGARLVGYLRILTDGAYIHYIHDVMVLPAWRGRGIGTRLVQEAVRRSREKGFIKIFLTAIPGLEAFYARMGFKTALSPVLALRGEDEPGAARP